MNKKDIIICRCEDVTLDDLHRLLERGYTDFAVIKRLLRLGMGPCQGTTCRNLILREISRYLKIPENEIKTDKFRPPTTGVKLKTIRETQDEK
ncbi:MAG: (2Fe-2S)-binding protein [Bacilli bacterium]|nr:(2Fe-2S)-binding protein [Bacilli bacterium]